MQRHVQLAECSVVSHVLPSAGGLRRHDTRWPNSSAPNRTHTRAHWEALFLEQLPTIDRLIAAVTRRHRMSAEDAEDFAAEVHLRLINDDYAVLRKFDSRCQLRTFLAVVVRRMFLDYRNAQWGKWRPSVLSVREGPIAVRLEQLTMRDGFTFAEACDILETNDGCRINRTALAGTYGRFRKRARPRFVNDDTVAERAVADVATDQALVAADARRIVAQTADVLRSAVRHLPPQDRLILELRFRDGMSIADISRRVDVDQKWLYRTLKRLLDRLRRIVEDDGMAATDVLAASSHRETSLGPIFPGDDRDDAVRPTVHRKLVLVR